MEQEKDFKNITKPNPRCYGSCQWRRKNTSVPTWEFCRPGRYGKSYPKARVQRTSASYCLSVEPCAGVSINIRGFSSAQAAALVAMYEIREKLGPPRIIDGNFWFYPDNGYPVNFTDFMFGGYLPVF